MTEPTLKEQIETVEDIYRREREYRGSDTDYADMKAGLAKVDEFISEWMDSLPPLPDVIDMGDMSPAEGAITMYRIMSDQAIKHSMSPAWEVMCLSPKLEADHFGQNGDPGVWRVVWESGPYDWAVHFTMGGIHRELVEMPKFRNITNTRNFIMEPYYGFDICFSSK